MEVRLPQRATYSNYLSSSQLNSIHLNTAQHFMTTLLNNMNSQAQQSPEPENREASHFQKVQPIDLNLTHQQYMIIQHFLPKRYALIQHKNIKRSGGNSAVKLGIDQTQNLSKLSGNVDNTEEMDGRTKRIRTKKVDKYLEDEMPKVTKRMPTETFSSFHMDDDLSSCFYVINQLKKHKNAYPFLNPVDPIRDEVPNYFDVIKEPMDLSTVQRNLNNDVYQNPSQFHAHINKIWSNSYLFNEKSTLIYKLTQDMERYYKSLLSNNSYKKDIKGDKIKQKERENKSLQRKDYQEGASEELGLQKRSQSFMSKEEKPDLFEQPFM